MAINKNHPDCPAYTREWNEICQKLRKELETAPPPVSGVRDESSTLIYIKYAKQLKEVQKKYAHLFD